MTRKTVPFVGILSGVAVATLAVLSPPTLASSHREAPFITSMPKVDATDFYMFRSYEAERTGYVTLIANYLPLQDPYGGPNYFSLDPNALYEIHIDNNGDAQEDITFQFKFKQQSRDIALDVGGKQVAIPLIQAGVIDGPDAATRNVLETYTVDVVRGGRRGARQAVSGAGGSNEFPKPLDNIGNKTIPNYEQYANQFIQTVNLPGCDAGPARVFVGQRKDPFAIPVGRVFDLINLNPLGATDALPDALADKNVTSLVMEVPIACLKAGNENVIGGWTTASVRQGRLLSGAPVAGLNNVEKGGGAWTQVSRLGMPLVNEVVIGLKDKDRFNSSKPSADGQFADYVTNPTLPALIQLLFPSAKAPTNFPRGDLVAAFLTGVPGLNQPANVKASEMLRLNTSVDPKPAGAQKNLGVLAGDLAGFPNGRRPGDDVVDASLRVAMGVLCTLDTDPDTAGFQNAFGCKPEDAPAGAAPLTDQVEVTPAQFNTAFPYLRAPLPGATAPASN